MYLILTSIIIHILQMRKPKLKQAKVLAQGHTAKVNTNNMNHGNNLKSMLNFNLLSLFFKLWFCWLTSASLEGSNKTLPGNVPF